MSRAERDPAGAPTPTPFAAPEHRPFYLPAADGKPARGTALLVHGFPGTPSEVRPLGEALHARGWTVRGPLLPGFGPDIDRLGARNRGEWLSAVRGALHAHGTDRPSVVVGYSLGAALVIAALGHGSPAPDRLILVAPFHRLGAGWQRLLWPAWRRLNPEIQPFADVDPADPETRRRLARIFGEGVADDERQMAAIRDIRMPSQLIEEVARMGDEAFRAAGAVAVPTLVLQGRDDEIVTPIATRGLVARLGGPTIYQELPGGHEILLPSAHPATWPIVRDQIVTFADRSVTAGSSPDAMNGG